MNKNKMGTASMLPLIISMSLPAMFSMLVQAMYNVVDSIFVSRLGEDAVTAISLGFPLQMLVIAVAAGTGVGLNSVISRRLGENNQEMADLAASHGFYLAMLSAMCFAVFGALFSKPFLRGFTDDPALLEMGGNYLFVVLVFSFGSFVQITNEKVLQATGNMFYPMVFQLVGAVTNIILDPIFIFGYFGVPAMGVVGAAIATVSGQILAMLVSLYVVVTKPHGVKIRFRGFRFHGPTVKSIYAVGIPSMVMQSITSILISFMNMILIGFSSTAVWVFSIFSKVQSFVFMPIFGLNQGLMPIMGYNYGAGNKHRLQDSVRYGELIGIGIALVGTFIFYTFPAQLLSIFAANEVQLQIGVTAFRVLGLSFPLAAFSVVLSTLYQALGNGVYSLIMSLLRQLILLFPLAYYLSKFGDVSVVWWSLPLAEALSLVVAVLLFIKVRRERILPMPDSIPE